MGLFTRVDSDSLSFELAAKMAYRAAGKAAFVFRNYGTNYDKLEVVTPEENMGDIVGDLNASRDLIEGATEQVQQ